jgi:hypothetical protein
VLVTEGMNARRLARAIVLSDDFRVSHALADDVADEVPGYRKVRPKQLERLVEDLTGLKWQTEIGELGGGAYDPGRIGRVDLVSDPFFGYGVLFGGTDAFYVTKPSHSMNATASAVLRNVAAKAASFVATSDFKQTDPAKRKLLTLADAGDTSEPAVRAQLAALHARVFGALDAPDSEAVSATYALFADALRASNGDARRAWTVTLFAMLQDVRLVFY